jgi:DNA-binding LytR/AlgR family response regulator
MEILTAARQPMQAACYPAFFFIRNNGRNEKVIIDDIQYIMASKNYTKIVTKDKTHLAMVSLKQYEELLPPSIFVRIQRGCIVSLKWVESFDQHFVYGPGQQLPIGDMYRGALMGSVRILTYQAAQAFTEI